MNIYWKTVVTYYLVCLSFSKDLSEPPEQSNYWMDIYQLFLLMNLSRVKVFSYWRRAEWQFLWLRSSIQDFWKANQFGSRQWLFWMDHCVGDLITDNINIRIMISNNVTTLNAYVMENSACNGVFSYFGWVEWPVCDTCLVLCSWWRNVDGTREEKITSSVKSPMDWST